jgi:hypothetical protein
MARSGKPRISLFESPQGQLPRPGAEAMGAGVKQGSKGYLNPVMQQNYGIDGSCVEDLPLKLVILDGSIEG